MNTDRFVVTDQLWDRISSLPEFWIRSSFYGDFLYMQLDSKRPLWEPLIFQMLLSRAFNSHGKSSWMRAIL